MRNILKHSSFLLSFLFFVAIFVIFDVFIVIASDELLLFAVLFVLVSVVLFVIDVTIVHCRCLRCYCCQSFL